jgi:hypothetical protein
VAVPGQVVVAASRMKQRNLDWHSPMARPSYRIHRKQNHNHCAHNSDVMLCHIDSQCAECYRIGEMRELVILLGADGRASVGGHSNLSVTNQYLQRRRTRRGKPRNKVIEAISPVQMRATTIAEAGGESGAP